MHRWLVVCVLGCGRISFDPATGPFGTPAPLTELNTNFEEDDPSLTADMLEIYFQSTRDGTERLYRSTRARADAPWSPPVRVSELDAGGDINNARVTPDGLAIYFASRRAPSVGGTDLWVARRATRADPWSAPAPVGELATVEHDFEPWVGTGELWIYFSSRRSGMPDVWHARRETTTEPFGAPTLLESLSSPAYDGGLWVDPSERLALFHSERDGDSDLYQAVRGSRDAPFEGVQGLDELNTAGNDQDAWLSPDRRTLYFVSDRDGTSDLFVTTR